MMLKLVFAYLCEYPAALVLRLVQLAQFWLGNAALYIACRYDGPQPVPQSVRFQVIPERDITVSL